MLTKNRTVQKSSATPYFFIFCQENGEKVQRVIEMEMWFIRQRVCKLLMSLKVNIWNDHLSALKPSCDFFKSSLQEQLPRLLEGHPKLFRECWLSFVLFTVKMIPHCFSDTGVSGLVRLIHES